MEAIEATHKNQFIIEELQWQNDAEFSIKGNIASCAGFETEDGETIGFTINLDNLVVAGNYEDYYVDRLGIESFIQSQIIEILMNKLNDK